MNTGEAITQAEKHLQHPPNEWKNSMTNIDLKKIPPENISTALKQRTGFWSELTNKKQWEVTIKFKDTQPTVIMDDYSGKFIDLSGPLN
jgi:plasmid maintenance system killer protein